jgi:hypothetical protein
MIYRCVSGSAKKGINMQCETRSEMRVYAMVFLVMCCFLCSPCAGEESKPDVSSSIGTTFVGRCDLVEFVPGMFVKFLKSKKGLNTTESYWILCGSNNHVFPNRLFFFPVSSMYFS